MTSMCVQQVLAVQPAAAEKVMTTTRIQNTWKKNVSDVKIFMIKGVFLCTSFMTTTLNHNV